MIPALVDGALRRATAGARGLCPECRGDVYARIPEHAIRHWAHTPLPDGQVRNCTRDSGEMSEWHRRWQWERQDLECIEVAQGEHRADLINAGGVVIEIQHSSIPPEEIKAREAFWKRGVWLIDGTRIDDGEQRVRIRRHPDQDPSDPYRSVQWPRAPLILYRAKWAIWIDLGESANDDGGFPIHRGLIQVRNFSDGRGNGWIVSRDWFIENVINGTLATFKSHKPPTGESSKARKQVGHARQEKEEDLTDYEVNCDRAIPDYEPCQVCGGEIIAGPWIDLHPACAMWPEVATVYGPRREE